VPLDDLPGPLSRLRPLHPRKHFIEEPHALASPISRIVRLSSSALSSTTERILSFIAVSGLRPAAGYVVFEITQNKRRRERRRTPFSTSRLSRRHSVWAFRRPAC
jgi:hypothetical protein